METRLQAYRFSSKVAGVADLTSQRTIGDGSAKNADGSIIPCQIGFMLTNPTDLLSVENVVTHFRASNFSDAGATVIGIGICYNSNRTSYAPDKLLTASIAQASGVIDITRSLGGIVNKTGDNVVMIQFDRVVTMTIEVWKNDMLYTVVGVK